MNILFLCTGNISRSYLAEMLLKYEISRGGLSGINCLSAGILENNGMPADPFMVEYLVKKEIPHGNHSARLITALDVSWADRILVMEKRHRRFIQERWPEADTKVEMLSMYVSPDQADDAIIDPFGKGPFYYRLAQSQITLAIKALYKKLERKQ